MPVENQPSSKASLFQTSILSQAGRFSYLGFFLVVCIVLGYFCGSYVDRKMQTAPWFLLLSILLGSGVGLFEITRVAKKAERSMQMKETPIDGAENVQKSFTKEESNVVEERGSDSSEIS